jgi:uncharacterized protein
VILYLDTSSLVKLYVDERHSEEVRKWVKDAEIVATCRVAFPEAMSALYRKYRAGDLEKKAFAGLTEGFSAEWRAFAVIDFEEQEAGRLAVKHGLRGFDAIHLSSAGLLKATLRKTPMFFSSFDEQLNRAARGERMTVMKPE